MFLLRLVLKNTASLSLIVSLTQVAILAYSFSNVLFAEEAI